MSGAAEKLVDGFTHPRVTDVGREILTAIARLILEGQTTTPAIGMNVIATAAHVRRRTVLRWIPVLVEIEAVRLVDGGQGRPGRYTLVGLAGAAPIVAAPLPGLIGAAKPRPTPKRSTVSSSTPDLFEVSTSEDLAIGSQVHKGITGWRAITCVTSWASRTITSVTSWAVQRVISSLFDRSGSQVSHVGPVPSSERSLNLESGLGVDGTRARDVLLLKERTTTTAAPAEPSTPRSQKPPPCRWLGKSHAWCAGRIHVPKDFHDEERRKLGRRPGETDADLDARLFARYADILAAIPETEEIPDKTEFAFWNRVLRSGPTGTKPKPRSAADLRQAYACPHDPPCDSPNWRCHQRTAFEAARADERKFG